MQLNALQPEQAINCADFAELDTEDNEDLTFPVECLPTFMAELVHETCKVHLVPPSIVAPCVLGAISAAIGAGAEIRTSHHSTLRANLFLLVSAETGVGKSRVFDMVMNPLFSHEQALIETWHKDVLPKLNARIDTLEKKQKQLTKVYSKAVNAAQNDSTQTELAEAIRELEELKRKRVEPQMFVADVTQEKLALILSQAHSESVSTLSADARSCIDVLCGRYSRKTDESIYLVGHAGDRFKMDRINGLKIRLRRPCLSVCWYVQPDKVEKMIETEALMQSGFIARFLMVKSEASPQRLPSEPHQARQAVLDMWAQYTYHIVNHFYFAKAPQIVMPSTEAYREIWHFTNHIRDEVVSGSYRDIAAFSARWAEQAWKLMLILHIGLHGSGAMRQPVSHATAQNAIKIVNWFMRQQISIISPSRQKAIAKRLDTVLRILEMKPNGSSTFRDMKRLHAFPPQELQDLADKHPTQLKVETVKPSGAGRPSQVIRLQLFAT